MAENMKRFTVTIPAEIKVDLDEAKRNTYYRHTQNEMMRDLIMRGLVALNSKQEETKKDEPKPA